MKITHNYDLATTVSNIKESFSAERNLLTRSPLTPEQEASVERQRIARENTVRTNAEDMFIRVCDPIVNGLNSDKDIVFKAVNDENKSVTFSKEDVKRIGEMVLEGIQPNRLFVNNFKDCLDYDDYARMAITKSAIKKYSEDFLTEEQAEVVNGVVDKYIEKAISHTNQWISDNQSEKLFSHGYYKYYGNFVCTDNLISQTQKSLDDLREEYAKTNNKDLKDALQSHIESRERDLEKASFWMSNSASDKSLIKAITDTFENANLTNTAEREAALDSYNLLMKPVVSAVESGRGLSNIMNIKMQSASGLIDKLIKIGYSDRVDITA